MSKQLFSASRKLLMDNDTKYSRVIKVPQYMPSKIKPDLHELIDKSKYTDLITHINQSTLSDLEKDFLKLAASRHIIFNYDKIADFYTHSNVEMQKLMEESALVIIDVDDAIANGYVKLTSRMQELIDEQKRKDRK